MPSIDKESGALVIRIVYDGPPFSGKTTSLRSLAQGLGVKVTTPQENEGRTLFFDWMEYSGGLFDGRRIKCQLLSVPGQEEFRHRRRALLESADVVVMVANTREPEIDGAARLLLEVLDWSGQQTPPVGLVIQANQRDAPDRVPSERLRERLCGQLPIAIVETVASQGDGVRAAFVLSVRLALDRARDLASRGKLTASEQDTQTADELLASLEAIETALVAPEATTPKNDNSEELAPPTEVSRDAPEVEQPRLETHSSLELETQSGLELTEPTGQPEQERAGGSERRIRAIAELNEPVAFVPDPMMPGGLIWPPVHGRAFLHEVASLRLALRHSSRGDWSASGEGWRVHSGAASGFESTDAGRPALIDWARIHANNSPLLSAGRAVILSPWHDGTHRLWQLVRIHRSMREELALAVENLPAGPLAEMILASAEHLGRARAAVGDSDLGIKCSLWNVSAELNQRPVYLGLMPEPHQQGARESEGEDLIEREFGPFLRTTLMSREDRDSILRELERRHVTTAGGEQYFLARIAAQG